ncbi:putative ribonuclease H-like domain-containing protein, partial [Tanacetum coccineum]
LEQIHEDDLEVMDLKWQLSLLSMRANRYYQRTDKKIFINTNDIIGYDKSKVECFNCHKMGHFAKKCRASRNKEGQFRNQDNTRKHGNNEDTSSKAMLAIDGVGFDWSDMAEEQLQTNMALMAFSDFELNQTEFTAATYKRGLATIEEQLITYRKNEVLFSEEVAVLKREVAFKDYEINVLKTSKDLDKLFESQITDKSKKGLGYNVVPLPHPLIYNRPKKLDLSYYGLDEFKEPKFKGYGSENSKQESNTVCDKKLDDSKENSDDSLVKEQVSKDTSSFVESPLNVDKETIFLANKKKEFVKPKNHEDPVKKSVRPKAVNTARPKVVNTARPNSAIVNAVRRKPQSDDTGFVDSGCSRHMTRNIAYLSDFKEFDGGYVTFGGGAHGGRISGKGALKTNSLDFEDLPNESQILLKIPRKDNMYSFEMKNIVPKESLTCLVAKVTLDESILWHRRLGQINFKNINKLVKDNLVRGLPTKHFENDQTYVACLKGKQHRASCKSKILNPITKPLFMLHMDLFGPTFVSSLMHQKYCLVVTDDYNRFTWVFFLTKDETGEILKNFIKEIENLLDKKVKIIRSDNGTNFKNKVMDDFCREKADFKLPTTFWAEAVSNACYVQNRVLLVKLHNKTPDELFRGKFDGKSDEGFFVRYSLSSKAFRVYNTRTRRVEENLHISSCRQKEEISQECIVMPIWKDASYFDSPSKDVGNGKPKSAADDQKQVEDGPYNENDEKDKSGDDSSPKEVNTARQHVNTASPKDNTSPFKLNTVDPSVNTASSYDPDSPKDMFKIGASHTLETTHVEFFSDKDEPEVDLGNITNFYTVPTTPNTRIHKDHLIKNVIGDVKSTIQTRRMTKSSSEQGFFSDVYDQ